MPISEKLMSHMYPTLGTSENFILVQSRQD